MARPLSSLVVLVGLSLCNVSASAQQPAAAPQPTIKKGVIKPTSPSSGSEMYTNYCAVCHGLSGKGDGPAAVALKAPPPDLSGMTRKNGGKFPSERVASALNLGVKLPAHGSPDMPVWGPLLRSLNASNDGEVKLRVANLVEYVESLQVK